MIDGARRSAASTRASLGVQSFDPVGAARHQPHAELRGDRRCDDGLRRGRHRRHQFRPDLRPAAPDRRVVPRHRQRNASSCGPIAFRCSAMRMSRPSRSISARSTRPRCPTASSGTRRPRRSPRALTQAGYIRIGLDHFALPDDAMAVALREGSAAPQFPGLHHRRLRCPDRLRRLRHRRLPQGYVQNEVGTGAYAASASPAAGWPRSRAMRLTGDDRLRAEIIERIMCDFSVDLDADLRAARAVGGSHAEIVVPAAAT